MIVGWVFTPPKRHLALYSIFFRLPEKVKSNAYRRCWWARKPTLRLIAMTI
ncbi:MAG: hypothetical protein IKI11_04055 [Neisseriaceae bacterium]|nr:hypothetical protein [Neisseriaceae bacterium]